MMRKYQEYRSKAEKWDRLAATVQAMTGDGGEEIRIDTIGGYQIRNNGDGTVTLDGAMGRRLIDLARAGQL